MTHRLFGARLLDTDDPRLPNFDNDDCMATTEKFKDPIGVVVRLILKQFLSDAAALLTLAHIPARDIVNINVLMQVPEDWEPTFEMALKRNGPGDYEPLWLPAQKAIKASPVESTNIQSTDRPPNPDKANRKWGWVEWMPLPAFLFGPFWDSLVWHMRSLGCGADEGILVVRHERRNTLIRVARHGGSLITIQRQVT